MSGGNDDLFSAGRSRFPCATVVAVINPWQIFISKYFSSLSGNIEQPKQRHVEGFAPALGDNVTSCPPKARKAIMTSISALHSHHASPLQRLQDELQAEVSSGAISSSDQSALSSALGDIDSSLQSSGASDQSSGSRPSPNAFKSQINDLIQQEVSAGKLTSEQGTELQGIFKAAFSHGPGGAGGPPPSDGSASVDGTDGSSSDKSLVDLLQQLLQSLQSSLTDSTSSSATGPNDTTNASGSSPATNSSTSGNSATDLLQQFLQSLKSSLADSTYSAKGSSEASLSGVLINDHI